MQSGSIYILKESSGGEKTGFYKVGKANYPEKRKSNLQTGNPRKLSLQCEFKVDDITEAEAKKALKKSNCKL